MKDVTELTGFSPTLLRAWERRYELLEPERLPGGHRVYSESDLALLRQIKKLLDSGQSIGRIAALGREQLLGQDNLLAGGSKEALDLASNQLEVFRTTRYGGQGLSVSLRSLAPDQLRVIMSLYDRVKSIYEVWLYTGGGAHGRGVVRSQIAKLFESDLFDLVSRMSTDHQETLGRAALEDSKWGALGPLLRFGQGVEEINDDLLQTIVLLCRDHAKLMRNAFSDIDNELRQADESWKVHGLTGVVKKIRDVCPELEARLDWEGSYSSRCLETSAVDRVLYDFVRRLTGTGTKSSMLWVGLINDKLLRWAFRFEGRDFSELKPDDLPTQAVALSVGVSNQAALDQGYLGSRDGWAWFHWPKFDPPPGSRVCQCELG